MSEGDLAIRDVNLEHFSAHAEREPTKIVARLRGNADQLVRDELQRIISELHTEATRLGVREAVLDVRDLYFMNSSCLSVIVRWITGQMKCAIESYRIRFTCNANLRWQKRSLQAMATLGGALVVID